MMSTSVSEPLKFWRQLLTPSTQQLATGLFILRSLIAAFLALWVSMRLGLDKPATAMTTVMIVAQPQSGLVLAKSAYRALGTLIGCGATLIFLNVFAQSRELFIAVIALWVGLCAAGAARFRGFKAYGFILAGYTSCMIGFPAVQQVDATYAIALSRLTEVLIGIVCAGVIADVVLPQRLAPGMVVQIRTSYQTLVQLLLETLGGNLDERQSAARHAQLTGDILRLDALRASAYFEDAQTRVRNQNLRQLVVDYLALLSSLHSLDRLIARRDASQRASLCTELQNLAAPLLQLLQTPPTTAAQALALLPELAQQVSALMRHKPDAAQTPGTQDFTRAGTQDFARESALDLLQQLAGELLVYTRTYAALAQIPTKADKQSTASNERFVPHADLSSALAAGGRAALALLLVSSFWIASDWPGGNGAALFACVVCCFFAASPTPLLATKQMIAGTLMAMLMSWLYSLVLQPLASGDVEMLILLMTPFLAAGLWLMAIPVTAGLGTAYCLFFSTLSAPQSGAIVDPAALLNQGFALVTGMLVGALAFSVFIPAEGEVRMRRLLSSLRNQLSSACERPLTGLRARFESRCRDLQMQILATSDLPASRINQAQNYGLAILEIGHALLDSRRCLEQYPGLAHWNAAVDALLEQIALLARELTQENRELALLQLEQLMAKLNRQAPGQRSQEASRRLHSALFRLHAGLLDAAGFNLTNLQGATDAA